MATLDIEWNSRPDGGLIDLESLKCRSWRGFSAYFVKIPAPVTFDFRIRSASSYVMLRDYYCLDGEVRISGVPPSTTKDVRNRLAFVPAGCEVEGWHKLDKPATIHVVIIDDIASTRQLPDLSSLPPRLEFDNPLLRSLILRFQDILENPSFDVPGYAEALTELVMFELVKGGASSERRMPKRGNPG